MNIRHTYLSTEGLIGDASQLVIVEELSKLQQSLYAKESLYNQIIKQIGFPKKQLPIKGIYLWGNVGRGKTFLMDLFFKTLDIKKKKRIHFHRMMSEVHAHLQKVNNIEDPIIKIVKSMAKNTRVLCFDEFFVRDIGDAMILGKLLDGFFMHGITLITTSNISPSELYKDGLQREQFLPAIKLLEQNTDIIQIKDGPDYRLRLLENAGTFFLTKNEGTHKKIEQYCSKMAITSNQNNKTLEMVMSTSIGKNKYLFQQILVMVTRIVIISIILWSNFFIFANLFNLELDLNKLTAIIAFGINLPLIIVSVI